ncbi:hypothetical protein Tco_1129322 [Tanacetum coccineum]
MWTQIGTIYIDSNIEEFLRLWFKDHCNPYEDKVLPDAPEELVTELAWRRENTHNSATRESRVNRLNEEGLDRGSGGTGNTNRRCKLDFPRYDGSIDLYHG